MFLTKRFYIAGLAIIALLMTGFVFPAAFEAGKIGAALLLLLTATECILLWMKGKACDAERYCAPRFSNGDDNEVRLVVENYLPFAVRAEIIDEIPVIFQRRDVLFKCKIPLGGKEIIKYNLRPVVRGEYGFGLILLYVSTEIGLASRRIKCSKPAYIAVYPSYVMLNKYEFMAIHNNLTEMGIKRIRRIGQNTEFESIKEYISGDDYRSINWKASARRHFPMVNVYQDERSQQIYSIIDKGRIMQSAFRGMTLLDYAINASLALSYVAIRKDDKAGLATFAEDFETFIPASKQTGQMQRILDSLYQQQTTFGESDYSALCVHINKHISKRSLLVVYTNFDTVAGVSRQLEYLRQLAQKHAVLTVFFEDVEMKSFADSPQTTTEGYYRQVVASKFLYDKQLVALKLRQYGVYTLLTEPANLSVNLINKYLEMKARGRI
ncbi:MAG: DUF58 domain-containing protein [Dysgonamonadaceae bacterium]|jgi:uncharacterized protein (DUF58 family)|nr:DUF58 domain-containing protein [Dysgonamonadaceae bacterium]